MRGNAFKRITLYFVRKVMCFAKQNNRITQLSFAFCRPNTSMRTVLLRGSDSICGLVSSRERHIFSLHIDIDFFSVYTQSAIKADASPERITPSLAVRRLGFFFLSKRIIRVSLPSPSAVKKPPVRARRNPAPFGWQPDKKEDKSLHRSTSHRIKRYWLISTVSIGYFGVFVKGREAVTCLAFGLLLKYSEQRLLRIPLTNRFFSV